MRAMECASVLGLGQRAMEYAFILVSGNVLPSGYVFVLVIGAMECASVLGLGQGLRNMLPPGYVFVFRLSHWGYGMCLCLGVGSWGYGMCFSLRVGSWGLWNSPHDPKPKHGSTFVSYITFCNLTLMPNSTFMTL